MRLAVVCVLITSLAMANSPNWQQEFAIKRHLLVSQGKSEYFVLEPGFRLELVKGDCRLTSTVLHKSEWIHGVQARVIEDKEVRSGTPFRVLLRYCAIDRSSGDVYCFGESLDQFGEYGQIVRRTSWRSGESGARFGLLMPGKPVIGQAYYQEYVPKVAMDRCRIQGRVQVQTPAGVFSDALQLEESSPLVPNKRDIKVYAPGLGLVQSSGLKLVARPKQGPVSPRIGEAHRPHGE